MRRLIYIGIFISCLLASPAVYAGAYEDMLAAVSRKDAEKVGQLLLRGMDVNTTDVQGNTLLMLAARNGDVQMLDLLIRNRANLLKVNQYRDSALHLAALRGCLECVKALVDAGADVDPAGWTPLIYAAFAGHEEIVRYLLTLDVDIDAQSDAGMTALMAASRHNHLAIVNLLLEHDADTMLANQNHQTALDMARAAGHVEIAAILEAQANH